MDGISNNLETLRTNIWNNNDWVKKYKNEMNEEFIKLKKYIDDSR
jgi:hypothetical protein